MIVVFEDVALETSSAKVKNQPQEKQFVVFNLYGHSIEGNYVLVLQLPTGRIVILTLCSVV